jgi:hypothetical protein
MGVGFADGKQTVLLGNTAGVLRGRDVTHPFRFPRP